MPATPLDASTRYFRRGVSQVLWVPTIASKASPSRIELNAGTDLSVETGEVDGWSVTSEVIETPTLGSTFVAKINGATKADDSSLTLYASQDGEDVRTLLTRGTNGFIVWLDEGDVPTQTMDVFPVRVLSQAKQRSMSDASMIQCQFAITSEPAENVVIPAAA
jgi:hypothetical protein